MPPTCARASRIKTPGMIGRRGKWPSTQGSRLLPFASQAQHARHALQPTNAVHRWISCHDLPPGNITDDPRFGGNLRAVTDAHVVGDAGLPTNAHTDTDFDRSGKPALR